MVRKTEAAKVLILFLSIVLIGGTYEIPNGSDEYTRRAQSAPNEERGSEVQLFRGTIYGPEQKISETDQTGSSNDDPKHISRGSKCRILLGEFEITAYTAGPESTGKRPGDPTYGQTASGVMVQEGVTIAADWDVLPKGTVVWIEGVGQRVVQDRGGAIKGLKIDLYMPNLDDAKHCGRQKRKVFILQ